MASTGVKKGAKFLLGVCMPSSKQNAAKIRVQRLDFDQNLLMYFKKYEYIYAHDPKKCCKTGDTVLIQNMSKRLTRLITHKIVDIVYPLGDITDPVTGKKIVAGKYRTDIEEVNKLYGPLESQFKYDEAPKRGSLEGTRDFTHKKLHVKHHEDPNDPQPYTINP